MFSDFLGNATLTALANETANNQLSINSQSTLTSPIMAAAVHQLPCFKDLIAVLTECFTIISLGYLSCRFKLISPEAKDLGSYLTTFALPMIIFLNIAQMEFHTINLSFLLCMLMAKLLLFITVTLITLAISYPTNCAYAGSLSILATQSNDFALGYPLIKSLYGETKPEMLGYLSLMAPIQLLILNPLGITMLEFHKSRENGIQTKIVSKHHQTVGSVGTGGGNDAGDDIHPPQVQARHTQTRNSVVMLRLCKSCEANKSSTISRETLGDHSNNSNNNHNNSESPTHQKIRNIITTESSILSPFDIETRAKGFAPEQQATGINLGKGNQHSSVRKKNIKSLTVTLPSSRGGSPILSVNDLGDEEFRDINKLDSSNTNSNKNHSDGIGSAAVDLAGFASCTCDRSTNGDNEDSSSSSMASLGKVHQPGLMASESASSNVINWSFVKALASNPLIFASVVALIVNLTHGPQLPKVVTKTANTIAASFAAPALFVVGSSMYGKFELLLRNPNDLLLASVLVATKELILPNIMRTLAVIILPRYVDPEELPYLVDFSYLYGLLPTAPTACIIANQYGVLSNVVSISMLLSTFTSAPLMLTASAIITQSPSPGGVENVVTQTIKVSSLLSMTLASLTVYALWRYKKNINYVNFLHVTDKLRKNPAHIFLPLLATTQTVIGIGGLVWYFSQDSLNSTDDLNQQHQATTTLNSLLGLTGNGVNEHNNSILAVNNINNNNADQPMVIPMNQDFLEPGVVPVYADLRVWTVCTVHYIFSSFGFIMARFVILSIVVTMFANIFKGRQVAVKVSRFMITSYAVLGIALVIWLIIESSHLKCTPAEPSLPSQLRSSLLRLAFNAMFLLLVMPLFTYVFRSDNKIRRLRKLAVHQQQHQIDSGVDFTGIDGHQTTDCMDTTDVGQSSPIERNFVTSCASLSSETSSALTANTNLDLTIATSGLTTAHIATGGAVPVGNHSPDSAHYVELSLGKQSHHVVSDALSIMLEPPPPSSMEGQTINPQANIFGPYGTTAKVTNVQRHHQQRLATTCCTSSRDNRHDAKSSTCNLSGNSLDNIRRLSCDADTDSSISTGNVPAHHTHPPQFRSRVHLTEFNKYSILIVFMLVDSIINFTSILQILSQEKPNGTFRQIEIMNVALDFGQGVLTFLIYGLRDIFFQQRL